MMQEKLILAPALAGERIEISHETRSVEWLKFLGEGGLGGDTPSPNLSPRRFVPGERN